MTKPDDLNSLCGRQLNAPAVHNYPRAWQDIKTRLFAGLFYHGSLRKGKKNIWR